MSSFRVTPRPAPTVPTFTSAVAPLLRWLIGWLRDQRRRMYWRVLLGGVVALIALWALMTQSKVEIALPVFAVLFGALGPVTFLVYWRDRGIPRDLPGRHLLIAMGVGAGLGIVAPLLLYGAFAARVDRVPGAFLVALVDTLAIAVSAIYALRSGGPQRQRDGLLIGVAAGLGYTATQAITYGLIVFHQTVTIPAVKGHTTPGRGHAVAPTAVHQPHVDLFLAGIANLYHVMAIQAQTQLLAGVIWAAILCAAIWRERGGHSVTITPGLALTAALILALHTLWLLSFAHHWLFVWVQIPFDPYVPYLALVNLFVLAPLNVLLLRFFLRDARERDAKPTLPQAPLAASLAGYLRERRDNTRAYFTALARPQAVPVGGRTRP